MTDRPNHTELMDGVSRFLKTQVLPALNDRGLVFRLRVALYLLEIVQRDYTTQEVRANAQWIRLRDLIEHGANMPNTLDGVTEMIDTWNVELAKRIRAGRFDALGDERTHVLETLREALSVVQPRFDLALDCEEISVDGEK